MKVKSNNKKKFMFIDLVKELPLTIARKDVGKYISGISTKTLANADSASNGPSERIKIGRTVVYETKSLLEWLDQISTN